MAIAISCDIQGHMYMYAWSRGSCKGRNSDWDSEQTRSSSVAIFSPAPASSCDRNSEQRFVEKGRNCDWDECNWEQLRVFITCDRDSEQLMKSQRQSHSFRGFLPRFEISKKLEQKFTQILEICAAQTSLTRSISTER
ncbi:hypothetical protein FIBSPDRAFT_856330 [Athelia psychrophila]|uniref:Uncharacterized protein n=1 Tax=Athelia psychrophila TaxID=1759441 RepID=A0A166NG21_9AGAM|nr:hypothetical protein FIBSPDRAFT_856321 [Fibularhizoctonia sp. CBS 109695]KZP24968.1 hypothetical protein FIBSPDRAFT_856330 [Fibularhizoctonia sp. CBS 109695]